MGIDIGVLSTKLTYGLYVAGVFDSAHGRFGGFVVDAVCQLSSGDEPVFVCSVMNKNYSKGCIEREGAFSLSVLPADVDPFIIANFGFQSSADVSKWDNVGHTAEGGLPVLPSAVSWARLSVKDLRVFDTHTAFFCGAEAAGALNAGAEPLRYADYFTKLKERAFEAFAAFKEGKGAGTINGRS